MSVETDGLGSLIARLDGASERPRIMLAAHMDELGLLVRRVTAEGFLKFQTLGGWLDQALINQRWTVLTSSGPVPGVSGRLIVDEVFRFEDLPGSLATIANRLGIEAPATIPTRRASGRAALRQLYEDPEIVRLVARLYAGDIARFGYRPPFDAV